MHTEKTINFIRTNQFSGLYKGQGRVGNHHSCSDHFREVQANHSEVQNLRFHVVLKTSFERGLWFLRKLDRQEIFLLSVGRRCRQCLVAKNIRVWVLPWWWVLAGRGYNGSRRCKLWEERVICHRAVPAFERMPTLWTKVKLATLHYGPFLAGAMRVSESTKRQQTFGHQVTQSFREYFWKG